MLPLSADPWAPFRAAIPATQTLHYLNSGWSGPLPTPVRDAITARLNWEWERGPTTADVFQGYLDLSHRLREQIAAALHVAPAEITLTQNTTEGINLVVNGLAWLPGDAVVTTSVEHSSGLVPCYYLQRRHGVGVRVVHTTAADSPGEMAEHFAAAITPGVKLVVLSHISYSTGQVFPLAEIQARAHAVGARVLVDGAQSFGQMPLDLRAVRADYYAVPAHKWLLGPDGMGALFVRHDLIRDLDPARVSGRAVQAYEHDGSAFVPERDLITKFELTTTSPALMAGMSAALDFYARAGPSAVWDRLRGLAGYAGDALTAIAGVRLLSPAVAAHRSGLVTFTVDGAPAGRLSVYLQIAGQVVCRGVPELDAVRLSVHYFNTEADIDAAVEVVRRAVRHGIPADIPDHLWTMPEPFSPPAR